MKKNVFNNIRQDYTKPIPSLFLVILIALDIAMVIDLIKSLINKDKWPYIYIEKEAKIY